MGRNLRRITAALLAVLLLLPAGAVSVGLPEGQIIMRIGLFYGAGALPGANLENSVGAGYRFGYLDENRQFVSLGDTDVSKISVVKAQNVYFVGDNYTDTATSSIAVGCYHAQMPGTYQDFESARAVAAQVSGGFPAWIDGAYVVRVGTYTTQDAAAQAAAGIGATVAGTSGYAVTVVKTGTSEPLFQFDGGAARALTIRPGRDDSVKTVTWCRKYRYYGDFQYQRVAGGNITLVNVVPLEDYIKGVITQEMNPSWHLEALKAQAICARTYAVLHLGKHGSAGFDLCNTTDCQAYIGLNHSVENSDRAVDETAGLYAWYGGELAETYYYSSNGGATEDVKNVWGDTIPYLTGQKDPHEAAIADAIPNYRWTVTFTKEELAEKLRASGRQCGEIVDFYVSERSPTGNVIAITFVDAGGKKWTLSHKGKELCRTFLGLRSINYTIAGGSGESTAGAYFVNDSTATLPSLTGAYAVDGSGAVSPIADVPYAVTDSGTAPLIPAGTGSTGSGGTGSGTYTISGTGWGHSVGMSQFGAYAMAKQGMTYEQILTFYFTGIEVR